MEQASTASMDRRLYTAYTKNAIRSFSKSWKAGERVHWDWHQNGRSLAANLSEDKLIIFSGGDSH